MADYDSSLPVRTENDGDVVAKIGDASVPSQQLGVDTSGRITVKATDGSGNALTSTGGSLDANVTNTVTVTATDLDIRDLTHVSDSVKIGDGVEFLAVNGDGSINSVVTATDLDIRDLTATSDSVAAHLFDEAGVAFGASNPLPVVVASDQEGDEVVDYNTSAAVASAASVNHDYTVTVGKTLIGEEVWASGSGKIKVQVLVNGAVKFVGFNSTANPNVRIPLERIVKAAATEVVSITITNRDQSAQDVYSTLTGVEV